ncbi:tetratricopeptide repeat protein [Flavobacterium sp. WC2509]|uniref:tetratricopeptide repeat protein n=1 Tax=Flavobacterium sp. WC2509 TaxID=3461406 RepID=UPI004044D909
MKYIRIFIFFFLIVSCQHKEKIKQHNPWEEIPQNLHNENAIRLYSKSTELMKNADYDSAKAFLLKSLNYEKSPIIYNEIGTAELAQKNFQQAIEYFQKSIDTDPKYYPSYINMSRCYLSLQQFEKGKILLTEMIEKTDSEYWKAYGKMYLALIYFNGYKDCEKAKELLEESIILENDKDLSKQHTEFKDNVDRTCG